MNFGYNSDLELPENSNRVPEKEMDGARPPHLPRTAPVPAVLPAKAKSDDHLVGLTESMKDMN